VSAWHTKGPCISYFKGHLKEKIRKAKYFDKYFSESLLLIQTRSMSHKLKNKIGEAARRTLLK